MLEIKVWAQMFFEDGSVTEGKRFDADIMDNISAIGSIGNQFLTDTNREQGFLLLWGAGSIQGFNITSSLEESDSSQLESCLDLSPEVDSSHTDSSA